MFIIVGAPCIVLAILAVWIFPDKPETAKFFTEEERKLELERMARGKAVLELLLLLEVPTAVSTV